MNSGNFLSAFAYRSIGSLPTVFYHSLTPSLPTPNKGLHRNNTVSSTMLWSGIPDTQDQFTQLGGVSSAIKLVIIQSPFPSRFASLRTSSLAFIPTEPQFTADTEVILCVSIQRQACWVLFAKSPNGLSFICICPYGLGSKARLELACIFQQELPWRGSEITIYSTSTDLPHLTLTDSY